MANKSEKESKSKKNQIKKLTKEEIERLPFITCYTDGSCSPKTHAGGWCAYMECCGKSVILSGYEENTTISRMEIIAVLEALKAIKIKSHFEIFSDSQYVVNTIAKKWIYIWARSRWRTMTGKVANKDLWLEMLKLLQFHDVKIHWVRGHNGISGNELCNEVAKLNMQNLNNSLCKK